MLICVTNGHRRGGRHSLTALRPGAKIKVCQPCTVSGGFRGVGSPGFLQFVVAAGGLGPLPRHLHL